MRSRLEMVEMAMVTMATCENGLKVSEKPARPMFVRMRVFGAGAGAGAGSGSGAGLFGKVVSAAVFFQVEDVVGLEMGNGVLGPLVDG